MLIDWEIVHFLKKNVLIFLSSKTNDAIIDSPYTILSTKKFEHIKEETF